MNVFKPQCDPRNPACLYNKAGKYSQLPGCTTDEKYVFTQEGDFAPHPGADYLTYDFHTWAADMGDNVPAQFTKGVEVTQKSPQKGEKAEVLFYRLGGMCNANQWVTTKELNPWQPDKASLFYQGGILRPTSGPCAGKEIIADEFYHKDTCEKAEPEPSCCRKMGQGEYAHECAWEDRWWCRPASCALIPEDESKERCGAGINTFFRTSHELVQ